MIKQSILLAEDDDALRGILVEKLTESGYLMIPAENGEVAMSILRTQHVDLLLLDILMPKNGMEVLEEMHHDPLLSKIPVIIVSNSGQPIEIDRARELGAKDF